MALEEPTGHSALEFGLYGGSISFLGARVISAEYREANDPETEIWRACQKFGTTGLLVSSVPDRVYLVDRTRRLLTMIVLRFPV